MNVLRFFKGNNPGIIILIAVIFIAIWIHGFIHPTALTVTWNNSDPMPLYGLLTNLSGNGHFTGTLISFFTAAIMAFLLVNFNTRDFFINERTYLPALMYVMAGGLFPGYQCLNPVLPASVFLMIAIIRIVEGYRKAGLANNFFDAGFLISTGTLFYANLIWFGVIIFVGIALIRAFNLSEVLISILGLITPFFLCFGIYYVAGSDTGELLLLIRKNLFLEQSNYLFTPIHIISLIIVSIIVIICMADLIMLLNSKKIKSRKTFSLLIWLFIISLLVSIIMPSVSAEIVWITAIPASYFLTHYFIFSRKRIIPEIFFSVLMLVIILIQVLALK